MSQKIICPAALLCMPGKWDANYFQLPLCFLKSPGQVIPGITVELWQTVPWHEIAAVPASVAPYTPCRAALCTRGLCSSTPPSLRQAYGIGSYAVPHLALAAQVSVPNVCWLARCF